MHTRKFLIFFAKTNMDMPSQIKALFDSSGRLNRELSAQEVEATTHAWALHLFNIKHERHRKSPGIQPRKLVRIHTLSALHHLLNKKGWQGGRERTDLWQVYRSLVEKFVQELAEVDEDIQKQILQKAKSRIGLS